MQVELNINEQVILTNLLAAEMRMVSNDLDAELSDKIATIVNSNRLGTLAKVQCKLLGIYKETDL